tara:strand:+ start:239 stop:793 length:555 start_codon:yes stop_codon:yes gene_type:complete
MYAKGGMLPGYEKSVPTQTNSGRSGGGGGFGGGSSGGSNTGSGRFAIYDYSARFGDKFWEVSRDDLNGKIVASDNNSNVGSVNQQLARDWIENDRKRRLAEEQGSGSGDGGDDTVYPHIMYNCETGTGVNVPNKEKHDYWTSLGYVHNLNECSPNNSSFPGLTDNQRFLLIGLLVVGLFAKRVM